MTQHFPLLAIYPPNEVHTHMYNKTYTNIIRTAFFIKFTQAKLTQITSNGSTDKLCYIHIVEYYTNYSQQLVLLSQTILNERIDMEEYILYHFIYIKFKNSSTLL